MNGKRIFEGDIVRNERVIGVVSYSDERAAFMLKWKNYDKYRPDFFKECMLSNYAGINSLAVISNIHDNPELLERNT